MCFNKKIDENLFVTFIYNSLTIFDEYTIVAPKQSSASQCSVCKIMFKSKWGLAYHEAIVRKYNILHNNFYKLLINEFKKKLFLIHFNYLIILIKWEWKLLLKLVLKANFWQPLMDIFTIILVKLELNKCTVYFGVQMHHLS